MTNCSCGACCEACGHTADCIRFEAEPEAEE